MAVKQKRIALYLRVSTDQQSVDSQLQDLRRYSYQRGFEIVREYRDEGVSGSRTSRPGLDGLLLGARRREFDCVLVWSFSRFSRSLKQLVLALEEFQALSVDFISYSEALDTSTPAGRALFGMVGIFAEFERQAIIERVRSGLRAAKLRGKKLGRPRTRPDVKIRELRGQGASIRHIARELGLARATVRESLYGRKSLKISCGEKKGFSYGAKE